MMVADNLDRGAAARCLMRRRDHAALATSLAGRPYVSLVAVACDLDASPLLLLSDLAQHTRNLLADPLEITSLEALIAALGGIASVTAQAAAVGATITEGAVRQWRTRRLPLWARFFLFDLARRRHLRISPGALGEASPPSAKRVIARQARAPKVAPAKPPSEPSPGQPGAPLSLLFEDTGLHPDPLAAPRLTLLGHAERCDDPRAAARFAARHPASAFYADFADFHLYRVTIERGHLVAGFGRIAWIEADDLRFAADASALAAAEAEIVAHMNEGHADAIALYAERLLGRPPNNSTDEGWRMTGIDPEGTDLRRPMEAGGETARLDFAEPVLTPAAARRALVALTRQARNAKPAV
jgi:putative heme iron utilization protein